MTDEASPTTSRETDNAAEHVGALTTMDEPSTTSGAEWRPPIVTPLKREDEGAFPASTHTFAPKMENQTKDHDDTRSGKTIDRRTLGNARGHQKHPPKSSLNSESSTEKASPKLSRQQKSDLNTAAAILGIAITAKSIPGLNLDHEATDLQVTAKQMFYQWAMGKGPSERHFSEKSVMGKELMKQNM